MTRFAFALVCFGSLSLAACGDDATTGPDAAVQLFCNLNGGEACFVEPTVSTTGEDGTTASNWACPAEPATTAAAPIMVSGKVNDFQEGSPLVGATVEAFL